MNQWEIVARELEKELGAKYINIYPGTNPSCTVEQIKVEFYKILNNLLEEVNIDD